MMPKRRAVAGIGAAIVGVYLIDKQFYYSTLQRNILTLSTAALITIDFKLNFNSENSDKINEIHTRTAERILNVCQRNGETREPYPLMMDQHSSQTLTHLKLGLYIKFAQQLLTVPVLPSQYFSILKRLLDHAPTIDYSVVSKTIQSDFNASSPLQIFDEFDAVPIASASIAQVHKAKLKDGRRVAVKIQKPEIGHQLFWDMLCYRILILGFQTVFDLPLYWTADYIEEHLRQEVDFINEARNAERCLLELPAEFSSLVHVPKVYHDYSTRRVLTTEWIDGVPLTDVSQIRHLGIDEKSVMKVVVDVFADQIFRTGFIHADPHSANILCRVHPSFQQIQDSGKSWWNFLYRFFQSSNMKKPLQVVLLDHGLYVQCSKEFTKQYRLFWKGLFTQDFQLVSSISKGWGIGDSEVFATATISRPYRVGSALHKGLKTTKEELYLSHIRAKERISHFLSDSDKLPKELIFVGRNINCIRFNNKLLGSPVNRINLMAEKAVSCIDESLLSTWGRFESVKFQLTLTGISVLYSLTSLWHSIKLYCGSSNSGGGFEEVLDNRLKENLEKEFPGLEIDVDAFDA